MFLPGISGKRKTQPDQRSWFTLWLTEICLQEKVVEYFPLMQINQPANDFIF
jgi:hypothetical protein